MTVAPSERAVKYWGDKPDTAVLERQAHIRGYCNLVKLLKGPENPFSWITGCMECDGHSLMCSAGLLGTIFVILV